MTASIVCLPRGFQLESSARSTGVNRRGASEITTFVNFSQSDIFPVDQCGSAKQT